MTSGPTASSKPKHILLEERRRIKKKEKEKAGSWKRSVQQRVASDVPDTDLVSVNCPAFGVSRSRHLYAFMTVSNTTVRGNNHTQFTFGTCRGYSRVIISTAKLHLLPIYEVRYSTTGPEQIITRQARNSGKAVLNRFHASGKRLIPRDRRGIRRPAPPLLRITRFGRCQSNQGLHF